MSQTWLLLIKGELSPFFTLLSTWLSKPDLCPCHWGKLQSAQLASPRTSPKAAAAVKSGAGTLWLPSQPGCSMLAATGPSPPSWDLHQAITMQHRWNQTQYGSTNEHAPVIPQFWHSIAFLCKYLICKNGTRVGGKRLFLHYQPQGVQTYQLDPLFSCAVVHTTHDTRLANWEEINEQW